MTPRSLRILALLGIGTAALSCAPGHTMVATATRDLPADMLVGRVKDQEARLVDIAGRGSIAFETPERAGSAYFSLSLRKPDSLLVSFEGPFGIDAGFLFLCRQRFVMYNSLQNRVTSGVPSSEAIRSVIPLDLTFDQIMDAFTGGFPLPDAVPARYTVDDDKFLLVYRLGDNTHSYWVDPAYDLVVRYEVHDAHGALLLDAEASRVVEQDGFRAPGHVTVTFPAAGRRISIHYTQLDLNTGAVSFVYTVPANARTSGH